MSSGAPKQLPDTLSEAAWEKFQGSPFAKNLYLSAYSYALVSHAYEMVKTVLYDSNVSAWQDVGRSSNEGKTRTLGAYFAFLLAQSLMKGMRSETEASLALKRDTISVTELLFGDQVAAKKAAEGDAKLMASDFQDVLLTLQNGTVMAKTIDVLLGTGSDASAEPPTLVKQQVVGESYIFHKENLPKSLRYAADRMK